jgi:hypothetical protein
MAKRKALSCDLCDLTFPYPSKYKRHLESESHRRFSASLSSLPDEVEETQDNQDTSTETLHLESHKHYQVHFVHAAYQIRVDKFVYVTREGEGCHMAIGPCGPAGINLGLSFWRGIWVISDSLEGKWY